jgi:hypothetical protein
MESFDMTREDIIRMAREAGLYLDGENQQQPMYVLQPEELIRFATLVAAAEREACAKQLDALGCDHCAAAIRARGQA